MGYRLQATEPLDDEVRRIVTEQIDDAIDALDRESLRVAVHEARKSLKSIRAALRLVRVPLGERTFGHENHAFRDIGRELAPLRDAEILVVACGLLKSELRTADLREALAPVYRRLARKRRVMLAQCRAGGELFEHVRDDLCRARLRVQRWRLENGHAWEDLRPGFARVYTQGRQRFVAAYKHPSAERFHAWRKRVKDLMFQFRLLEEHCPQMSPIWSKGFEALSDILGEEHDLAVLRDAIDHDPPKALSAPHRAALLLAIDRRRARLTAAARPLGNRLYTARSHNVADRLGRYWSLSMPHPPCPAPPRPPQAGSTR